VREENNKDSERKAGGCLSHTDCRERAPWLGQDHARPPDRPGPADRADYLRRHRTFNRVDLGAAGIEVDTTSGYHPGLAEIAAFVSLPACRNSPM
jgi:hypothetical protein